MVEPVYYASKRRSPSDDLLTEVEEIVMVTLVTAAGQLLLTAMIKSTADGLTADSNRRGWQYASQWSTLVQASVVVGLVCL